MAEVLDYIKGFLFSVNGVGALIMSVIGVYMVRGFDRFGSYSKLARAAEEERLKPLVKAAVADPSIFSALSAEASRLHTREIRAYLAASLCFAFLLVIVAVEEVKGRAPSLNVDFAGKLAVIFIVSFGFISFARGRTNGVRADSLHRILIEVWKLRGFPTLDRQGPP